MSKLITPSLVGSIKWAQTAPPTHIDHDPTKPTWAEQAKVDLHNQLARIPSPPGKALLLGIRFEDAVYEECKTPTGGGSDLFKWFVEECRGGRFQQKTRKIIEVDGVEYCLYGKMDAPFHDIIKDVKTTSNYKGRDNYLSTFQHKMYCFNEHIGKFRYLVGEFDKEEKLIDKHAVDYVVEDWDALREEVIQTVRDTITYLKQDSAEFEFYNHVFSRF